MLPVEANGLTKHFGSLTAVSEVSFHIAEGEIFGLLGPNGSGKTTTINMLTGMAKRDGGAVSICGADPLEDPQGARSRMGIVPEESNLYEEMDGLSNLIFCAALYGMRRRESEDVAKALLRDFGLDDAGRRPFRSYSKGMKRRLTIAAALMVSPKVLILDEPTSGIDVESSLRIRKVISSLRGQGVAVLLTTHNIEEAQSLCDRVAFIVKGSIVRTDTVPKLLGDAAKEAVLRFELDREPHGLMPDLRRSFPGIDMSPQLPRRLTVRVQRGYDISDIVGHLNRLGAGVLEVKADRPTLEEVFVRITGLRTEDEEGSV